MILGLGMDLVEIDRVRAMVERHGVRACTRLFTPGEIAYANRRSDPMPHFAARFAAKEAAFKALAGTSQARRIGWCDIEVVNGADGKPSLRFHGAAAERAREMGVADVLVTLTHTHVTAAATVILITGAVRGTAPSDEARG